MADLIARSGDSWQSPVWAVALNGAGVDLTSWFVHGQARSSPLASDVLFDWTVTAGNMVIGSAQVQLQDGTEITTDTVQLVLRPADWTGKPTQWRGVLEIELASDATPTPAYRYTLVTGRNFLVAPETVR